ncbi:MAG: DUF484 domain-containing protein [Pseudomonadota bacterium]|nr:DUF484 domain-containing protein [Pseudomonadota bacterium]
MATVIPFEDRALARLRERLGAAEEARADLIAFARGHSGAVASIHEAVLAAIGAGGIEQLVAVVTEDWPLILGLDSVAFALIIGGDGFRADCHGVQRIEPRLLERSISQVGDVEMRGVARGHPLFGPMSKTIRAEALIAVDCGAGLPRGLLLLGQRDALSPDTRHGAILLRFLGRSLAAMLARWLTAPTD